MKKLICFVILALGILGCTSDSDNSANAFEKMNTNTTQSFTDISFINKNQGIICGSLGFLSKTNNGGKTWTQLNVGDNQTFMSAFMVNEQNFFTARLDLFATSNSGATFKKNENLSVASTIFSIKFFNSTKGLLIRGGSIFRTIDSGNTWTETYNLTNPNNLEITSDLIAYAYGGYTSDMVDKGEMLKTIDGGQSWANILNSDSNIISASFISDNIGYYVNNKTELHKTVDGSKTWVKIASLPVYPSSVCFINEKVGYVSTYEGKILETKDAGLNWKIVYNEPSERIFKIITKEGAVFAIGDNGLFLRKR